MATNSGVVQAMTGMDPRLTRKLRPGYNWDDLAGYEEQRRTQFTNSLQDQLAQRRSQLSSALTTQGKSLFDAANPGILEDLNSRGLFSSPSAVANAQGNALRDIGLENQRYLNDFDTQATGASLQSQQDNLDTSLGLRSDQLQANLQESQANREQSLAESLARRQGRNNLTNSLIGAGGSIGAGLLAGRGGGLGSLFGGNGGGGGGGIAASLGTNFGSSAVPYAGAGSPASSLFPGGLGAQGVGTNVAGTGGIGLGGGLAIAGAGYGAMKLSQAGEKKYGTIGGVLANPIGYQLNKAKQLTNKAFGGGSHTDTKGNDAWMQNMNPNDIATKLGTDAAYTPSFDSNQAGSYERNYNNVINNFTPEQLVARYSQDAGKISNLSLDQDYKKAYDQAAAQVGRPLTPEEFAYVLGRA